MQISKLNLWYPHHHYSYGKNTVEITYKGNRKLTIELTSSEMKLFKLYNSTNRDFRTEEYTITESGIKLEKFPLTKDQLSLNKLFNDPTNYYKNFTFSLTYNQIKDIYENKKNELTINRLNIYINNHDYLHLLNKLQDIDLSKSISEQKNKYNNILIDLKDQIIPNWAIQNVPIEILFGFKLNKNKNNIEEYKWKNEESKSLTEIYIYDSYFGNKETYETFKELLKFYLDGILLYLYKDEILTYSELKEKYFLTSKEYFKISKEGKVKQWEYNILFNQMININPNIQELPYKCISISDPKDLKKDSLGKLNIQLELLNTYKNNVIIEPKFITKLHNFNRVQKNLWDLW